MSQPKESPSPQTTGKLPEPLKFEFRSKSPQIGYEAVYGQQQLARRPSITSQRSQRSQRRPLTWWEDLRKNSPQSFSLAAATLIFASGGMNLAYSIGFSSPNIYETHIQFSWFIAVIIGACISTIFVHTISKRIFNLVASSFVIISGVFHLTATQSISTIISARYCDGFAFGLTLIPTILAGSEISVKRFRGLNLSTEQIGLAVGALIRLIYTEYWGYKKLNALHGFLALFYGIAALMCTFLLTIETPVFLLRKALEEEAVTVIRRLQRTKTVTNDTYTLLNESKELLEEDWNRSKNISIGIMPMIKITLFRSIVSMSISFPLTLVFMMASSMTARVNPSATYTYILMRLIGVIFSTLFLDTVGRRIPSAISLLFGGGIMFCVGFLSWRFGNTPSEYVIPIVFLMLFYQLSAGIIAPTSTCYLSEAFSVSVKPLFILGVVIVENLLQVIICCLVSSINIPYFAFTLGGLHSIYAVIYFFMMPETMQKNLREALKLFQRAFVWGSDPDDENDRAEETDV